MARRARGVTVVAKTLKMTAKKASNNTSNKTWNEKLAGGHRPHVSVLTKGFVGVPAGATLFVPSPMLVRDYMRAIPRGEQRTIAEMRQEMAARHKARATCPLTASLFARIAAEAALEDMGEGKSEADVAPFWRLIDADSALGKKLSCGPGFIRKMQEAEARKTRRAKP